MHACPCVHDAAQYSGSFALLLMGITELSGPLIRQFQNPQMPAVWAITSRIISCALYDSATESDLLSGSEPCAGILLPVVKFCSIASCWHCRPPQQLAVYTAVAHHHP